MGLKGLIFVLILFMHYKSSVQDASFLISKNKVIEDYVVTQNDLSIEGNAINMTLKLDPRDDFIPTIFIKNGLVLGNPRSHVVSAFTDTPGILVVKRKNDCYMWRTENLNLEELSKTSCFEVKKKMEHEWDEFVQRGHKQLNGPEGLSVIKTVTTMNRKCKGSIRVLGHGIDNTDILSCSVVEKTNVLFIPKGVIIGHLRVTDRVLFTNNLNTLLIVRQETCEEKTFNVLDDENDAGDERKAKTLTEEMYTNMCDYYRRKIKNYWDSYISPAEIVIKKSLPYLIKIDKDYKFFYNITIEGNGILTSIPLRDTIANHLQLLYIPGGFMLADRKTGSYFELFSDSYGVLVDLGKRKTKVYKNNEVYRQFDGYTDDQRFDNEQLWREAEAQKNKQGLSVYRQINYMTGGCVHEIIIKGRGVDDVINAPCFDSPFRAVFTNNGMVLGDYRTHSMSLFMERDNILVIIEGENKECKRRIYDGKESRIDDLPRILCDSVKQSMEKEIVRSKQRYMVELHKRNSMYVFERTKTAKGKCKTQVLVNSNEISDFIITSLTTNDQLKLLPLPNGFALGDCKTTKFCVYTDEPNTLIVIREKAECQRKEYAPAMKITRLLTDNECADARNVLKNYWSNASNVKENK